MGTDISVSDFDSGPDFWVHQGPVSLRGGPHFADLIEQVRRVQDEVVTAQLSPDEAEAMAQRLAEIADTLTAHRAPAPAAAAPGARLDLPGRGHPFLPPHAVSAWTDSEVRGQVTFSEYFVGGNSAAAGAQGVLFSDIMGRLSISGGRPVSRAAYLHVNYRSVCPVGQRLDFDATVDRIEGRKRFITGRLRLGDVVVSDAEGLFVEMR